MREIEYKNNDDFERKLISAVCKKIEDYIQQISPNQVVYIAFDGVAPVAKLNQQKNRRYKSWFINNYDSNDNKKRDSTAITPGTEFSPAIIFFSLNFFITTLYFLYHFILYIF